jgi:hypothetical protein
VGEDYLLRLGSESLLMERDFNHQAGFTAVDECLAEYMYREVLPPVEAVFNEPKEEMDAIFEV